VFSHNGANGQKQKQHWPKWGFAPELPTKKPKPDKYISIIYKLWLKNISVGRD